MKKTLFEKKEDYLKARKSWATYFNDVATKKDRDCDGHKIRKLEPMHFICYNIMRGYDPLRGMETMSVGTYNNCLCHLNSNWFYHNNFYKVIPLSDDQLRMLKSETVKHFQNTRCEEVPEEECVA